MKILIISNFFPPNSKGGAEFLIGNLADELSNEHDVSVLTSESSLKFAENVMPKLKMQGSSDNEHKISTSRFVFVGQYNYLITRNVIKAVKPDVILINQLHFVSYAPLFAALRACATAVFVHDLYSFQITPERWGVLGRIRKFFDFLSFMPSTLSVPHALTNSHSTIRSLPKSINIQDYDVAGVGTTFPLDLAQILNEKRPSYSEGCQLAFLGRIGPQKGIHHAIKAVDIIVNKRGNKNIRLDIAGMVWDTKYLDVLKQQVIDSDLSSHVRFVGTLTEKEKFKFLCNADIFLFTSTWVEGHGMSYLESMFCRTPCICTAAGGAAEVLIDEENCLLYEAGNSMGMANAISRLIKDNKLRESIVTEAERMVRERFTIKSFTERCEIYLRKIIT
jgi:glycosyltransferase involved in cell wall biosynthesis